VTAASIANIVNTSEAATVKSLAAVVMTASLVNTSLPAVVTTVRIANINSGFELEGDQRGDSIASHHSKLSSSSISEYSHH